MGSEMCIRDSRLLNLRLLIASPQRSEGWRRIFLELARAPEHLAGQGLTVELARAPDHLAGGLTPPRRLATNQVLETGAHRSDLVHKLLLPPGCLRRLALHTLFLAPRHQLHPCRVRGVLSGAGEVMLDKLFGDKIRMRAMVRIKVRVRVRICLLYTSDAADE